MSSNSRSFDLTVTLDLNALELKIRRIADRSGVASERAVLLNQPGLILEARRETIPYGGHSEDSIVIRARAEMDDGEQVETEWAKSIAEIVSGVSHQLALDAVEMIEIGARLKTTQSESEHSGG